MTLVAPSSSRSLARRDGKCFRELNGGSTRTAPGTAIVACRAASRSGPNDRIVTASARRSPRRNGVIVLVTRRRSPAGILIAVDRGDACADGVHASRTRPRSIRPPRLLMSTDTCALSPSRMRAGSSRCTTTERGDPASARSKAPSTTTMSSHTTSAAGPPAITIGTIPSTSSATNQPPRATRASLGGALGAGVAESLTRFS